MRLGIKYLLLSAHRTSEWSKVVGHPKRLPVVWRAPLANRLIWINNENHKVKRKEQSFFSYLIGFSASSTCSAAIKTILNFEGRLFFFAKRIVPGTIDLDMLVQFVFFSNCRSWMCHPTQDGVLRLSTLLLTKYQILKIVEQAGTYLISGLWEGLTLPFGTFFTGLYKQFCQCCKSPNLMQITKL